MPMVNAFVRRKGVIRHFWACELLGNAKPERGQDDRH